MTYHIITIGCQMNKADSERLAAYLENHGYLYQENQLKSDLVIINTCGVRQAAEDRVYGLASQLRKHNPKSFLAITGCLSKRSDVQKRLALQIDLFFPINETLRLLELINSKSSLLSLDKLRELGGEKYLTIIPKYSSPFKAYIPIGNGCNNFCSYCVVPYARGREVYRPATDIIREAKNLIKNGYKEITLIAQNVNSYHVSNSQGKKFDFADLLSALGAIEGDFWLRFSSSHPKDFSDKLISEIKNNKKICNHIHLAVQSGDDDILKAMNRGYRATDYKKLIKKIRLVRPNIAISTDIIVGFPGESRVQFKASADLFKDLLFDQAFISRYSPRFGTVASKLKDNVSLEEKKRREKKLDEILKKGAYAKNQQLIGQTLRVLVEEKRGGGKYFGFTSSAKAVLFKGPAEVGQFACVLINSAGNFSLAGQVVETDRDGDQKKLNK